MIHVLCCIKCTVMIGGVQMALFGSEVFDVDEVGAYKHEYLDGTHNFFLFLKRYFIPEKNILMQQDNDMKRYSHMGKHI